MLGKSWKFMFYFAQEDCPIVLELFIKNKKKNNLIAEYCSDKKRHLIKEA